MQLSEDLNKIRNINNDEIIIELLSHRAEREQLLCKVYSIKIASDTRDFSTVRCIKKEQCCGELMNVRS